MKKIYILQRLKGLLMCVLMLAITSGIVNAQTLVNGTLSTGTTTASGVTAPAGYTWSECQNPTGNTTVANTLSGAGAQVAANNTVADDFIIPAGQPWNLTKITVYAYSSGYAGVASPFNDVRIRIHNNNPFAGPTTIVFGDLTTNRFTASSEANMYRIFNTVVTPATAPGTTRRIWKIEANIAVTLNAGTYWLEFQTGTIAAGASNFIPLSAPVGVRTLPDYNAIQSIAGVWANLVDAGQGVPADVATAIPFSIDYNSGACAGAPTPGNTIASASTVCPGINVSLSLQNATPGSGVTYQWQSAPALAGPYTPITGATSSTLTTTITAQTFFQAVVTCGANAGTSVPVSVASTPSSGCYCDAGSPDVDFEKIARVTFNAINNASTSTAGYENFLSVTTPVVQQSTTPITVTISDPFGPDQVIVWIDFNHNGNFTDAGERVFISATGVGPHTGNITIPATSLLGPTRMRVRLHDTSFGANATPCGNSAYGQVEDYTVDITPCVPLSITTPPANVTVECGGNAVFTVAATGSGPAYQWEERVSPTAQWTNIQNNSMYSGATTNTLTINSVPVSMNGYQYRVVFSGYCRATDFTTVGTLTVNPLVAVVNPASATICNGAIQQLTITNITSPQPASVNVASGAISVAIPDNSVAGATHTLNVAGIPTAAVITGVNVRFTIPHTYSGDLVIALKSPNGVLNLDYFVTSTFPGGNGFLNTVITSTPGAPALSSGSGVFTGTFRPDAQVAATANGPSGATGFAATTNSFAGLYTTGGSANGAWTIAIYDGGALDIGTLTSWDITINYLAGIPATGVWTSTAANTIFTDAAATVPYVAGTPVNSVYVHPTVTSTYSVVVSTPICTSGVTNVPVTVANAIGTVTGPANAAVCANGNTSFTVSAPGNPIAYQWEVSTDGGATWTSIANNAIYGGATTGTLTLTGTPGTYNNYRYRATLAVAACTSTATSPSATLTVNPTPVVVINAGPYTALYPGITTTITAAVSPNAASTYQWYRNGVAVPGATAATIVVDVDHLGDYSVTVNDVNGCGAATSSPAKISITAAASDIMFIYPSPNTGQFQVRYQSLNGNSVLPRGLVIYDSKGARVYSKSYSVISPYTRMDVDMTNYSKGIYRVELVDNFGDRIKTGSVVLF